MSSNLSPAQVRYTLARAWHAKGDAAPAIIGYREALLLDPGHLDAALHLGALLCDNQRLDEALTVYRHALESHPDESRLCKLIADVNLLYEPPVAKLDTNRASNEAVFPAIEPVSTREPRPFWSVMITAYRRTAYLEEALRSVLTQAPDRQEMQVEVVSDGPNHPAQRELEAIVRSVAGDRVTFYRHPNHAGHPDIFNVCLRRARGLWVHLLHDDDFVAPGFYDALHQGILQAPEIGAAFCRHTYVDQHGRSLRLSPLERETPGVLDNWLERIGWYCRLQTPSIVVRREAYEQCGGYCAQAKSAFDWEMWQRIAVRYPVWYEPKALAFFRESSASESTHLIASGRQIADTRAAIEIAQTYLPRHIGDTLARRAREHYAQAALELARRQKEQGNLTAAMANVREGLLCNPSSAVKQKLMTLLPQWQEAGI